MNPWDFEEEVYMPDTEILGWKKDESYDGMKDKDECEDTFKRSWRDDD